MIGEIAALIGAACWAAAPIIYKRAMSNTTPIAANTIRCASTTIVMFIILLFLGRSNVLVNLPFWAVFLTIVSGILGMILGDTFYMIGLRTVGVSIAAPIVSTYPLFGMIWAMGFLGDPVLAMNFIGAFIVVIGIGLLCLKREKVKVKTKNKFKLAGITAALATSFVWSFSILLMDIAMRTPGIETIDDNYALLVVRILAMSLIMFMITPLADRNRNFLKMKRRTVVELCLAGLIANGIGWLLMNYSLSVLDETAIVISSTTPLFSGIAAFFLFKEKVTWNVILGVIIIVVGVIIIV
ncbi:MAG: DMT family transporter [Crenarchaeota archaeon]|nr:DMT family transporter [Thermoproteota archaeon]